MIDRSDVEAARERVQGHVRTTPVLEVNGGNQTVPTLVHADGTAQTNPSVAQVKAKLAALAA